MNTATFSTKTNDSLTHCKFILQISCPDQKGLIAGLTQVLAKAGANILDLTQHTATDLNRFFMRALFDCPPNHEEEIRRHLQGLAPRLDLQWNMHQAEHKPRLALLGSRTEHCLYELLLKERDGELPCAFSCIISNHEQLEGVAKQFKIPFYLVPSSKIREQSESAIQNILLEHQVQGVILARYMQILSSDFCTKWKERIINIHHGFLPAFQGAKPYHQAWHKGVKLIGATAHYATEDLDQGPILWQEVRRVPDTAAIADLVRLGKDVEKGTLSTALKLWLEHRIFVFAGRSFIL